MALFRLKNRFLNSPFRSPPNFKRSAYRSLLSSTALLGSAKIALAQLFSFIFSKMNEAGFIHPKTLMSAQF
jgi:hypothetical protein